ncbi:RNA polymerase sigma-70 factor [Aestuariivivens sediminicola]|uniref:RNA polymerase sigma-70 factor n=1 Tax=Aestuariivivens sediminicola TaxID=2913560 RepID=UPI001F561C98|nr:RNA polymerase sigma-70 factor [Aestuariivivens sediminicola]
MDRIKNIFNENYKDLCICAYYYLKDINESEDVVQDVFVKIIEQNKLNEIDNIKGYLRISVRNASIKKIQFKKKQRGYQQFISKDSLFYTDQNTEVQELEALKNKIELYKQLDKLPKNCKRIFLLCVLDGLKYKEVAEVLGVSVNTVKTQMKKAFRTLRQSLKGIYLTLVFALIKKS